MPRAAAGLLLAVAVLALAQSLQVSQSADEVRVTAPGFHFLTGKPLERLQNGNTVAFDLLLTAFGEGKTTVLQRAFERFVISYDLWEQTYSVSRMRSRRGQAAHLTATQAEEWCISGITLRASSLPKDDPVWFRLEVRPQEPKQSDPGFDDSGPSLATLIEVFSRAGRSRHAEVWRVETGAVRLRTR
ncbi:MAG TPA: hypothetical protein VFL57_22555 [Bryobacteraceae bacterium]|nr:hypothetical protein [Bryobacteraceae bacterium]